MNYAGCEPAYGSKFLSSRNGAICFYSIGYFLANCNHVADAPGVVGPHRNLADDPMTDVALCRRRLLIDAFDLTALEHALKLFLQHIARLPREHLKNILAEYRTTRNTQLA